MSLVFSESTNKSGMYELFQDLTKTNTNSYAIAKFTRDANNAYANFVLLALKSSQKAEFDDTNQTDYPIVTINLVSGQQDYPLTVDASSVPNQVLDILRVECANPSGVYSFLTSYDQSDEKNSLTQLATISGTPTRYDKYGNALWLDKKPSYNYTNGLKIYFGRTPVYFLSTDTIKKPGIPDPFHEYLVYRPAYLYCVTNLPALAPGYLAILQKMEQDIANYYFFRNRDEKKRMVANVECSK